MSIDFLDMISPSAVKTRYLAKGDHLFRQDDPTFAIFLMQKGQMQLARHNENGDAVVIHHAHITETFAEAALFSDKYHCDAIALEKVEVKILDKQYILQQMQGNSEFSMSLSAHFARQIQTLRRRLEIQSIGSANARIYAGFAEGLMSGDIKNFAAKISLSHEATYRGLAKLVEQGKLSKLGRGRYILA